MTSAHIRQLQLSTRRGYATAVSSSHPRRGAPLPPLKADATTEKTRVKRDPKRPYPQRKAHIYASYQKLITEPVIRPSLSPSQAISEDPSAPSGPPPAVLLISHENLKVSAITKLRGDIANAVIKLQAQRDRVAQSKGDPIPTERLSARFQILRPRLFLPVVRKTAGKAQARKLEKIMKGPMAAVVMHPVDPPLVATIAKVIERAVPAPPREDAQAAKKKADTDDSKKEKPVPVPKMRVAGAYVEWKVLSQDGVKELSKLPTLQELRAQIVGLLGAPAMKLAGVLSQAAGGRLAATLDGYKRGLEEGPDKQ